MPYKPLRWGIIGAGNISHDFCVALSTLPLQDHVVTHVAARDIKRAKSFTEMFNVETHSGDYMDVMRDANVDVVYIGTLNNTHKQLSILAMNHGKAVLCEKPATLNSEELEEVLKVAEENKIFYMEAVWTRCFPIYYDLKSKLGVDCIMGEPQILYGTFGFKDVNKMERVKSNKYGGGVLLNFGIYLLTIIDMLFEGEKLIEIKATGFIDEVTKIDQMVGFTLRFEGHKMAQVHVDGVHTHPNEIVLYCTKGKFRVHFPFWCSEKYTECIADNEPKDHSFPLPVGKKKGNFHNAEGLRFEAEHVRQCLLQGLTQSPLISHDTSRRIMGYMDLIRRQIGAYV